VAAYLRAEADACRAAAPVKHRVAAVSLAHLLAKLPNPCDSEAVRLALKAIAKTKGTQQKQVQELTQR
jgi:hypothetical protein